MSAKEMFEKLGYVERERKEVKTQNTIISYFTTKPHLNCIYFDDDKTIDLGSNLIIDLDLLQAINKQIEELGWEINQ